MVKLLQ